MLREKMMDDAVGRLVDGEQVRSVVLRSGEKRANSLTFDGDH